MKSKIPSDCPSFPCNHLCGTAKKISFTIYPHVNGKKSNFLVPVCTAPLCSYHFLSCIFSSTIPMFTRLHPWFLAVSYACSNNVLPIPQCLYSGRTARLLSFRCSDVEMIRSKCELSVSRPWRNHVRPTNVIMYGKMWVLIWLFALKEDLPYGKPS